MFTYRPLESHLNSRRSISGPVKITSEMFASIWLLCGLLVEKRCLLHSLPSPSITNSIIIQVAYLQSRKAIASWELDVLGATRPCGKSVGIRNRRTVTCHNRRIFPLPGLEIDQSCGGETNSPAQCEGFVGVLLEMVAEVERSILFV